MNMMSTPSGTRRVQRALSHDRSGDDQDLKWRHRPETKPSPPPRAVPADGQRTALPGLILHAVQRGLYTLLLILGLIYFVSLASELGLSGGLKSLPRAAGSAWHISTGFLGTLFSGDTSASETLWQPLSKSLGLLATSLAVGVTIGLLLGAYAAVRRHTRMSGFLVSLSVLGISTPSYVAAMFLIWGIVWLFQRTGVRVLPIYGFGWDERLILPTIVLAARPMANMMRLSYSSLIDIFDADFVRTAHSKGLSPNGVFWRHILRNAGIPLLTTAGVSLRFSLSILPIVEYIFSWPGVGLTLLKTRDTETMILLVLPLAALFIGVNLMLDTLYLMIDPRLRSGRLETR